MKLILASLAAISLTLSPAIAQNTPPSTDTGATTQTTTTTTQSKAHKPARHHAKRVRHHHHHVVRHVHKTHVHATVKTTTHS